DYYFRMVLLIDLPDLMRRYLANPPVPGCALDCRAQSFSSSYASNLARRFSAAYRLFRPANVWVMPDQPVIAYQHVFFSEIHNVDGHRVDHVRDLYRDLLCL